MMKTAAEITYLTGLLVRDTLKDSRQLRSFSSEIPDRNSWIYSCEDSVHSCLLFFSPPYHRRQNTAWNHFFPCKLL